MYDYKTNLLDYDIICGARILKQMHDCRKEINTGFYMYPRSSISKSRIRLANNVGIIDAGYRGHLMGMFDCLESALTIHKFDRYLQICAPGLIPIMVSIVSSKEELGEKTARGEGGFGSTGK
jgi:dUTP pyrophosphatase